MSWGARLFVAFVFTILGLSFIATTVALFNEFQEFQWLSFATIYSHLFLFFPTFGIIALIAFYIPAVAFVDLYWHHIPFGKIRFIFGFLVVSAASYYIGDQISRGEIPAIWQLKPEVLKADQGEAVDCKDTPELCQRRSVSETIASVRSISQQRTDLSQFSRSCTPDPLKETPAEQLEKRYCFVSASLLNAESCCLVQKNFSEFLAETYQEPDNISLMSQVHSVLLPFKVFFLIVILLIGILLIFWRKSIDEHYRPYAKLVERSLLIGALAMLFWPLTNHAFLLSADLLYASFVDGIYGSLAPIMSILFGAWALMLLFFFFRQYEKDLEAAGKVIGVIGSMVAIIKYDEIIDWSVRIAGSGADIITAGLLGIIALSILFLLFGRRQKSGSKRDNQPDTTGA